ncbi:MAG: hypothetical protein RBT78_04660 [Kiritimatiellia bacterium]|jgi:hypothetical protein|nr:hypothetical protein [Kiritimatiellia bacterium]
MLTAFAWGWTGTDARANELKLTVNPYAGVDWERMTQHKANLHTHTFASGGRIFGRQVFEEYAKRGYTILSVTEHDIPTCWRDAAWDPLRSCGVLAIDGQEYSKGRHVNGFFLEYTTEEHDTERLARAISGQGGVSVLNHPGRYWKREEDGRFGSDTLDEVRRVFEASPSVLGMEVFNRNERRLEDAPLWDALLAESMPQRPIWGFANDDTHELKQVGHNWEVFLLNTLDRASVREAMRTGSFYFCARKGGRANAGTEPPVICSIRHDPVTARITVSAAADGAMLDGGGYRWVAEGQTVCTGPVLPYRRVSGIRHYVRAELTGRGGVTYTNPFGFGPLSGERE